MATSELGQYAVKVILTVVVVVAVAEISKRSTVWGALLASLPLTSLLAFVWLYIDTRDAGRVAALSKDIFWLVIPSLPLFLVLPALLKMGWSFWTSLAAACAVTAMSYLVMLWFQR
jgi:hypothetical protein